MADIVEKLFWARFCATLILFARPLRTKDSNDRQHRFDDCVTHVEAGVFQQYRRNSDPTRKPLRVFRPDRKSKAIAYDFLALLVMATRIWPPARKKEEVPPLPQGGRIPT